MTDWLFALGTWLALFIGLQMKGMPIDGPAKAFPPIKAAALATILTVIVSAISYAKFHG
jgi:hypothetical protein